MLDILEKRFSGRLYDPTRAVTSQQLDSIIEAGRMAPSCYNEQPWAFIICNRNTHPESYEKLFDALVEFNQGWAKNAPVLVLVVAGSKFAHKGKPNRWGAYDSGAAALSMALEATALGLMAHQMGGFDEEKARHAFAIPEEYSPMAVMAIGYASAEEKPTPKDRKLSAENFFMGQWGH